MDAPDAQLPNGIWRWLGAHVSDAEYRPHADPAVTVRRLDEDGATHYVLRQSNSYLRLDEREYALWQQMDGARTVRDLVVFYFTAFGSFGYARVAQLVADLKAGGFLVDKPAYAYRSIREALAARDPGYAGQQAARAFLARQFPLTELDPYFTRLYRRVGRYLFHWLTLTVLGALAVAGFVVFLYLLARFPTVAAGREGDGGSVLGGLLTLLVASAALLVVHEHAHALTTKHFGRRVPVGGVMIYYGMPAFYVNLMDIWMEPKGARVLVTAAGPISDAVVGGVCSLLAFGAASQGHGASGALFLAALTAYISVYTNLNPLLELDGYLILQDWLGIARLRERAFAFLRAGLWQKLRGAGEAEPGAAGAASGRGLAGRLRARLRSLSREERIFTAFGALALFYSAYSIWLALFFWQNYITRIFADLWQGAALPGRLALLAVAAAALVALAGLAGLWLWRSLRLQREWLEQRGAFADWRRVFAALGLCAVGLLLVTALAPPAGQAFYLRWMPAALLLLAAAGFARAAAAYWGARFRRLLAGLGLALAAAALARAPGDLTEMRTLAVLAAVMVLPGAVAASSHEDQALIRPRERRAAWVALGAAFLAVTGALWAGPAEAALLDRLAATGAEAALFAFLLCSAPWALGYQGTPYGPTWLTITAAAALTALLILALYVAPGSAPVLDLCAAALWALAGASYAVFSHRLTAVRRQFAGASSPAAPARLRQGFARLVALLFDSYRQSFGARAADALSDEMEAIGRDADWPATISQYRLRDNLGDDVSVTGQGDHYRELLQTLAAQMVEVAGRPCTARAVQAAYDALPWQEREALASYTLAGTAWEGVVTGRDASARGEHLDLLRRAPVFSGFDEAGFERLLAIVAEGRAGPGEALAHAGGAGRALLPGAARRGRRVPPGGRMGRR
ncbi:MAG: M50 family metallopeptidase [Anaerolineae bacterium]|nr:M50 family metallopeptidase [Anaerolineae bacterium]